MQISTHSPSKGRDRTLPCPSIKERRFQPTLPAKGETGDLISRSALLQISTHSPSKGRDVSSWVLVRMFIGFQPTLPAKGETRKVSGLCSSYHHFNPLSQQRERHFFTVHLVGNFIFQPTLPAKGETDCKIGVMPIPKISTHSPSKGRDSKDTAFSKLGDYFNPLSQQRERHCPG